MRSVRRVILAACCGLLWCPIAASAEGNDPPPKAPGAAGKPDQKKEPSPPRRIDLSNPGEAQKGFNKLLANPKVQELFSKGHGIAVPVKTETGAGEVVAIRRVGPPAGEPGAVIVGDGRDLGPAAQKALGAKSALIVSPVRGLPSSPASQLAVAQALLPKGKTSPVILAAGWGGTQALVDRVIRSGGLGRPLTIVGQVGAQSESLFKAQGRHGLNVSPNLVSALGTVPNHPLGPAALPGMPAPASRGQTDPVPLFAPVARTGRPLSEAEKLTFGKYMAEIYERRAQKFGEQAAAAREDAVTAAGQSRPLAVLGNSLKEYLSRATQYLDLMGAGMFEHPGRTAADMTPILGTGLAFKDFAEHPSWLGAAVLGTSVIPGVKGAVKAELRAAAKEARALETELQAAARTAKRTADFKEAALRYVREKGQKLDPVEREAIEDLINKGYVTRGRDVKDLVAGKKEQIDFLPGVGEFRNPNGSGESAASLEANGVKGDVYLVKRDGVTGEERRIPLIGPRGGEDGREHLLLRPGERIEREGADGTVTVLEKGDRRGTARPAPTTAAAPPRPEPVGVVDLTDGFGLTEDDLRMFEAMRTK